MGGVRKSYFNIFFFFTLFLLTSFYIPNP